MSLVEELVNLLRENNLMLRFICNTIISKEYTQDTRDVVNNVIGDMMAEILYGNSK